MKIDIGRNLSNLLLTIISAAVCGAWIYYTKGTSGIGWFVVSLIIIFGI